MRKKASVDFTRKPSGRSGILRIALIVAGVIFVGVISFTVILAMNDFDPEKVLGARDAEDSTAEETTVQTEEQTTASPFSDEHSINFLFICHDASRTPIFCQVISMSYAENVIRVKPVSTALTVESNGKKLSLAGLFELSGVGAVSDALAARGIGIAKYITVNETDFKMLLQRLGSVPVKLSEDVSYSVDAITYSFPKGIAQMTSDTLLKYMKYAAADDELLTVQANAMAQILRTHLTAENLDKGESFFSRLINLVSSDISAFDFNANREKLRDFLRKHPPINVIE